MAVSTTTGETRFDRERLYRAWTSLRERGIIFVLVTLAAFLIFLRTLAPGVLQGDSGEFQFAAWGWTLVHPTGYPLYLIAGGLFQHLLPVGDPAYRLNLLSAVLSALTVGVSYRIYSRVTGKPAVAVIAALTLAVSPTFWSQATESEVYALNTLLVATLFWLALRWSVRREFIYSAGWSLVFGLALAHHRSIILLIPGFAAFFTQSLLDRAAGLRELSTRARSAGDRFAKVLDYLSHSWLRRDLAYAALALAPLILYLYIPLRNPATPYAQLTVSPGQTIVTFPNTPSGWLANILGTTFESDLYANAASLESLRAFPEHLIAQFNPVGAGLGLIGLAALLLRRRIGLVALSVFAFAGVLLFAVSYHIGDIADFYTPAWFVFALWIAAGLGAILDLAAYLVRSRVTLLPTILLLLAFAVLPMQNLYTGFVDQDRSLNMEWGKRWRSILTADLPRNPILVSNDRDEMTPMWYLQLVEGLRPDALGLFPLVSSDPAYSNTMSLLDAVVGHGRPVLLIKPLSGLDVRYSLDPVEPNLYRVQATPSEPLNASDAIVGGALKVEGYRLSSESLHPGLSVQVTLRWQLLATVDRDYTTSLQLLDENGEKVAQGNDHPPGGQVYPTSMWKEGEIISDQFKLTIPPDLAPGIYHLAVRVYDAATDDSLGDLTEIGLVEVAP